MQIKLFLGTHTKQLEQEVNEWLKTLKASSVQIQTTVSTHTNDDENVIAVVITVIYEPSK